jgi:hypothetical protein
MNKRDASVKDACMSLLEMWLESCNNDPITVNPALTAITTIIATTY